MKYQELIADVKSVREFSRKEVKETSLKEIKTLGENGKNLQPNIMLDVRIMHRDAVYLALEGVAGYSGHMIDAPHYIVLLSEEKPFAIENAGFVGQNMVLKAEEMGLGTCWITFDHQEQVKEKLNIVSPKAIIGLIALGYADKAAAKKSGKINPSHRLGLDEIVFDGKWGQGVDGSFLEERGLLDAFAYIRLAPSALNSQPWRFVLSEDKVILAVEKTSLTEGSGKIAAGIVMLYFQSVLGESMFEVKWVLEEVAVSGMPEAYQVIGYATI